MPNPCETCPLPHPCEDNLYNPDGECLRPDMTPLELQIALKQLQGQADTPAAKED